MAHDAVGVQFEPAPAKAGQASLVSPDDTTCVGTELLPGSRPAPRLRRLPLDEHRPGAPPQVTEPLPRLRSDERRSSALGGNPPTRPGQSGSNDWTLALRGTALKGRYAVHALSGIGGSGGVLRAHDNETGRPVAVKVLAPGLRGERRAILRFQLEARAAAAVGGTGVAAVLDSGCDAVHGPFLVMEFLTGRTLQQVLMRAPCLTVAQVLVVVFSLLDTLARVHRRNIIHRDLKPANVFLEATARGRVAVKLVDFGVCRIAHEAARLTQPGTVVGTPRYMSPEQAQCGPDVDQRSDLFAVGLLMYEALSGTKPYGHCIGRSELMRAVAAGALLPLSALAPELPRPLLAVLDRVLQFDPDQRYPSAEAMSAALRRTVLHNPG